MAVVSISRIQVRRGTALQGTGLPQLASGEFGWAIDTQELYIGNGSTAEGAPAVGNTQILTQHSNILELAQTYSYRDITRSAGTIEGTIGRSVGQRLDDRVSVRAFGVFPGEASPDITDRLQTAIFELYLRTAISGIATNTTISASSTESRVVLYVEAGEYELNQTIYLPPYVTLVGAGKDKTIFRKTGQFHMFKTINEETSYDGDLAATRNNINSQPGFLNTTVSREWQSRHIRIEHMTLETTSETTSTPVALISLQSCRDSVFEHVRFKGVYSSGTYLPNEYALEVVSKSYLVRTGDNTFVDCDFIGLDNAAYGAKWAENNKFERCKFDYLRRGVILGDTLILGQDGPAGNVIRDSEFSNIHEEAFVIPVGVDNASVKNLYRRSVGNSDGPSATATHSIIVFGEEGNNSIDDIFERTRDFTKVPAINGGDYHPEVKGPVFFTYGRAERIYLDQVAEPVLAFRLPADATKTYEVEYFYRSDTGTNTLRSGVLEILINRNTNTFELIDNFDTNAIAATAANTAFSIELNSKVDSLNQTIWTADVLVKNVNEEGPMTFKVTSKS